MAPLRGGERLAARLRVRTLAHRAPRRGTSPRPTSRRRRERARFWPSRVSSEHDRFESPLAARYAGKPMVALFAPLARARAWRAVWIALAEAELELGAAVTPAQVAALEATRD